MSRYRKVEVRTYGDEKFCKLSRVLPSGQSLWLYLITGPHTTSIPGLFRAGRAALAEELGWEQEAFDKAFQEVFREGMAKADWSSRVLWIPNAIKHNAPENPNVVKGWATMLDLIPECALKVEALEAIGKHLESMNPTFLEAFKGIIDHVKPSSKGSGKGSPKASGNGMPNQEQEQEQEQERTERPGETETSNVPPRPPEPTLSPEMVAKAVQVEAGIFGDKAMRMLSDVAKREMGLGLTGEQVKQALSESWQKFKAAAPRLEYVWSAEKFFGEGHWKNEAGWPWKEGHASTQRNQSGGVPTLGNRKADRASGALARAQARILAED